MGGNGTGKTRKGRTNESGSDVQGGTLGHDQLLFKEPKVLLLNGKAASGTKAYRMQHTKT